MAERDVARSTLLRLEATNPSPVEKVIKTLGQYKELITIFLFFVGGALWIFGYFVTKTQFTELQCFAKNSIVINREAMRIRDADDAIVDRSKRLEQLDERAKATPLTEIEKTEHKKIEVDLKKLETSRQAAQDKFDKAQDKILNSSCSGGFD